MESEQVLRADGSILVVDDDDSILDLVQLVLEGEGYRVLPASDGEEALEVLRRERPKLILLDMRMPRMNGCQFAEAYRKMPGPHAEIIVVTAAQDVARAASEAGVRRYLGKPFDIDALIDVVHSCMGNNRSN